MFSLNIILFLQYKTVHTDFFLYQTDFWFLVKFVDGKHLSKQGRNVDKFQKELF